MLIDVLEVLLGSLSRPLSSCQFSIEKDLGNTAVLHTGDMAQPARARLFKYGVHGGDPCPLHHCVIGYFVSPGDAQDARQAVHVERVKSSFLLRAQSPRLTAVM